MVFTSESESDTHAFGRELGKKLLPNTVLALFGDLGAGKTTLIKGIGEGLNYKKSDISSPTFSILNIYNSEKYEFYHFDLYRLKDAQDFISMGFDDYFFCGGICCIEWPERILPLLPNTTIRIYLKHAGADVRTIEIQGLA